MLEVSVMVDGSSSNGCHTCGKDTPPTTTTGGGAVSYKDDSACTNGDSNRGGR